MLEYMYKVVENTKNRKLKIKLYNLFSILANILIRLKMTFDFDEKIGTNDSSDVIVSLTSFPERIDTVHIVIYTLLKQTVKPKKIILWLAENQFSSKDCLPKKLTCLEKRGLEIRFCPEDLKGHKKYLYTIIEFPNNIFVTVDDDLIYPKYTLQKLLLKAKEYNDCIICNRGHEKCFKGDQIMPYKTWRKEAVDIKTPSYNLCPTGSGGILYPVGSLHHDVTDVETLKKIALYADDLWLHAMALRKATKAVYTDDFPQWLFVIRGSQKKTLAQVNVYKSGNDDIIQNISEKYNFKWK